MRAASRPASTARATAGSTSISATTGARDRRRHVLRGQHTARFPDQDDTGRSGQLVGQRAPERQVARPGHEDGLVGPFGEDRGDTGGVGPAVDDDRPGVAREQRRRARRRDRTTSGPAPRWTTDSPGQAATTGQPGRGRRSRSQPARPGPSLSGMPRTASESPAVSTSSAPPGDSCGDAPGEGGRDDGGARAALGRPARHDTRVRLDSAARVAPRACGRRGRSTVRWAGAAWRSQSGLVEQAGRGRARTAGSPPRRCPGDRAAPAAPGRAHGRSVRSAGRRRRVPRCSARRPTRARGRGPR